MIYLDNSATTKALDSVVDAVTCAMRQTWFNPSAAYEMALNSEKAIEAARRNILKSLQAANNFNAIFTGGGTEGDNLSIIGVCNAARRNMRHIITTSIEHPAVLRSFDFLKEQGYEVTVADVDAAGCVSAEQIASLVREDTCLVSVMHVNNEVGAVNDVCRIAELVKERNCETLVHVDAVQAYLRVPIALDKSKIDLYSASGHKIHGPKGVGFLCIRRGVKLAGVQVGGGQEMGLRSGTQNVPGILGLERAVLDWDEAQNERIRQIKEALYNRIEELVPDIIRNGPAKQDAAPHILNIGFAGVRAETLLHALEQEGVLVATGSACSSKHRRVSFVLDKMGVEEKYIGGSIRISFGAFNTMDEVEATAQAISKAVTMLRRFKAR